MIIKLKPTAIDVRDVLYRAQYSLATLEEMASKRPDNYINILDLNPAINTPIHLSSMSVLLP